MICNSKQYGPKKFLLCQNVNSKVWPHMPLFTGIEWPAFFKRKTVAIREIANSSGTNSSYFEIKSFIQEGCILSSRGDAQKAMILLKTSSISFSSFNKTNLLANHSPAPSVVLPTLLYLFFIIIPHLMRNQVLVFSGFLLSQEWHNCVKLFMRHHTRRSPLLRQWMYFPSIKSNQPVEKLSICKTIYIIVPLRELSSPDILIQPEK